MEVEKKRKKTHLFSAALFFLVDRGRHSNAKNPVSVPLCQVTSEQMKFQRVKYDAMLQRKEIAPPREAENSHVEKTHASVFFSFFIFRFFESLSLFFFHSFEHRCRRPSAAEIKTKKRRNMSRLPRLPPTPSLSSLSHLLARLIDETVASAAPSLRLVPRFFERGWGDLNVVDFRNDELLLRLRELEGSPSNQERRRTFAAWLDDVERGPVLQVKEGKNWSGWAVDVSIFLILMH